MCMLTCSLFLCRSPLVPCDGKNQNCSNKATGTPCLLSLMRGSRRVASRHTTFVHIPHAQYSALKANRECCKTVRACVKRHGRQLEVATNTLKLVAQLRNELSFHPDDIGQPLQAKSICRNLVKVSKSTAPLSQKWQW